MRRGLLALSFMLCGLAAPRMALANTPQDAQPTQPGVEQGVEQEVAVVRVTIEQKDGKVLRATKATPWGDQAQFDLAGHDLDLSLTDQRHFGVRYTRNGSTVADQSLEARPRERVVVHTDADVKVTVQVIPVKVRVRSTPVQQ
ncbi:MAG: hypothetical protein KDK70_18150 [Myxococcales bacterium]|nr:hypothetical protein [Myxococcales bacterium]